MIRIIKKSILEEMQTEIDNLNKEIDVERADKNRIIDVKNKEISKLEKKININQEDYIKTITEKNKLIEELIMEKEDCKLKNRLLNGAKGGYTKAINKLKNQIKEKDKEINDNRLLLYELKSKNILQAEKIQELTKNTSHSIEEYKNNGLRKNMKKKRGNKNEK